MPGTDASNGTDLFERQEDRPVAWADDGDRHRHDHVPDAGVPNG